MSRKVLFMWWSMSIFNFIWHTMRELSGKKSDNWRQVYKQTSLIFHTSNGAHKRCWEGKFVKWRLMKFILPLNGCLITSKNVFIKLKKLKAVDKEFYLYMKKIGFFEISTRGKWKCKSVCILFMTGFLWSFYLYTVFFWCSEK